MGQIITVGMREFRENLAKYAGQPKTIQITSHGIPMGYYIPAHVSADKHQLTALKKATQKLASLLEEKGISEEEILAEFNTMRKNRG